MTYKLQDSSEETARISVTDTYGILPIANELLIALTYEGADSDHVADSLAQFEAQAIDLSHSLGGDLTNSFNEQLKQPQAGFEWNEDEESFIEALNPTLDQLNSEAKVSHYDVETVRQDTELNKSALDAYQDTYPHSDNDTAIFETLNDVLYTINLSLDNSQALGYVHTLSANNQKTVRKETLADLVAIIIDQLGMLEYAEKQKSDLGRIT